MKFQVFDSENLVNDDLAEYQKKVLKKSVKNLLKKYQFNKKLLDIINYSKKKKINIFIFNPEDLKKVPKKYLKVIKVPSGKLQIFHY